MDAYWRAANYVSVGQIYYPAMVVKAPAQWPGLPAQPAVSKLGYEHGLGDPAILLWNDDRHTVARGICAGAST
jgi:hypothetical protein